MKLHPQLPPSLAEWDTLYPYTADLISLSLCRPPTQETHAKLNRVTSPLNLIAWEEALRTHPDRAYVRFLLSGIEKGFRIGFNYTNPLQSASSNMHSAVGHPKVVQSYLETECAKGCMLGPFSKVEAQTLPALHVNRFGVIPKGDGTGKWRLITDLS